MLRLRRHDLTPRVELLPLIDVVFLLLTFFIYSLIVMRMYDVLPVRLTPLSTGRAAEPGSVQALTIDRSGQVYLNREAVDDAALDARLAELAAVAPPVKLFIAMEEADAAARQRKLEAAAAAATSDLTAAAVVEPAGATPVDRGPRLIALIEQVRRAGITDFAIVGDRAP